MTTIAWKRGILAADKKTTDGDLAHICTKMYRKKGYAIAFAGILQEGLEFLEWFDKKEGKCPLKKTDCLIMNLITGQCLHWEAKGKIAVPVEDECTAIGSGGAIAIGAMEAGATPQEAVRIASRRDPSTGYGVHVIFSKGQKDDSDSR